MRIIEYNCKRGECMLCQFSVKNYGCIKDEITLDMQATVLSEHRDSVFEDVDGETFLPLAVIYGPNGAGKSTILLALHSLVSRIMRPICATTSSCDKSEECLKRTITAEFPFKFSKDTRTAPTEYELFFRTKQYEYQYNLHVTKDRIVYERLMKKDLSGKRYSLVFEREGVKIVLKGSMRSYLIDDISTSIPLLSYLAITHGRNAIIKDIRDWLEDRIDFLNFDNPNSESRIRVTDDPRVKKIILNMLAEMDIDIVDYSLDIDENDRLRHIYTTHEVQGEKYELELSDESSGTIKLFGLIPDIALSLKRGATLVVDELDAKLHPLLLKYIIGLYSNKDINRHKAQLVFTSHDLSTMTNEVFRRDEIWFVAKSIEEATKLYSLVEFKNEDGSTPRKDAVFNKQYLEGRFGADPYLRRIIDWGDAE